VARAGWFAVGLSILLTGCGTPNAFWIQEITSVTPSLSGTPNSVVSFGDFEFVSVQGIGQISTYTISGGTQVPGGKPYLTPCADPSGMVVAAIGGNNVMAVACYDTGSLLTLTVNPDGSLSALGAVTGLPMPFPGIVLDGTDVLVPLFGGSSGNGGIAKVSIATPASPAIEGMVTLASPASGGVANAEYLAIAGGYVYVTAGSESNPLGSSSTVQVVNEATLALVGSPLVVPHSPQQIAVAANVAYVTLFDAAQLEAVDISNPTSLQALDTLSLNAGNQSCHPVPVAVQGSYAYVGCYAEGLIQQVNIGNPSQMSLAQSIPGISSPQRMVFAGNDMLVTDGANGGLVYQIDFR
jgi:hypothetical protein